MSSVVVKRVSYEVVYEVTDDDGNVRERVTKRTLESDKNDISVHLDYARSVATLWGDDPRPNDMFPSGNCRATLVIDWQELETRKKFVEKVLAGAKDGTVTFFNVPPLPSPGPIAHSIPNDPPKDAKE